METDEIIKAEIDVQAYWHLIKRWLWAILLATGVAAGLTYAVSTWVIAPRYQANVRIVIQPSSALGSADYNDIMAGQRAAATYAEILKSLPLQEEALRRLGYSEPEIAEFASERYPYELSAQSVRDTQIVELRIESEDRELATQFANTLIQVFIEENERRQAARFLATQRRLREQAALMEAELASQRARLESATDSAERAQIEQQLAQLRESLAQLNATYQSVQLAELQAVDLISIIESARLPQRPTRPRKALNTVIAAVAGGAAAIIWVFLSDLLDTRIRDAEEITVITQAPVLAQIWYEPEIAKDNGEGSLILLERPLSLTAEAFRMLRANLQFAAVDRTLRTVLISSPGPTEGKSTVALNLGLAIAATGQKVIVIDADMRRPRVAAYAGAHHSPGLSDALVQRNAAIEDYLQPIATLDQAWVLPPGKTPPNPAELLGSQRMLDIIKACADAADIVIVDSPPVLLTADSAILAGRTDGVLLVVEPRQSDRRALAQAVDQLQRAGARLLGTVLNKVSTKEAGNYSTYRAYRTYIDASPTDSAQQGTGLDSKPKRAG